ncbi:antibiotic biosynthesis monooxygenase [Mucilaginibacter sp. MD40]|uniref:putative quinol monooxygenase n=1 Tax=Mucilaginibacter sp. MD40 TaxID=2029590 RepID=UPI000BAC95B2|nr:putative quinol monooxygenase [Mucilaginibacter sp. MD40]PAW95544.1 antibiotic biosynthesis monooxygenase [Mucilaginibacter sp. MD40]
MRKIFLSVMVLFTALTASAQNKKQMVRIAKITVDPAQLEQYNSALKEQMTAAVGTEPGVLTYYAVADKKDPSHITILEIYADTAAYQLHIQTPHFKKYKAAVAGMVKSLELVDMDIIGVAKKPGM